jgi:hypothetical protein
MKTEKSVLNRLTQAAVRRIVREVPRGSRNSKPPRRSEPESDDPFSQLAIEAEAGSERESGGSEGGLIRKNPVERFDPAGRNNPKGERKSGAGESSVAENGQRAVTKKLPEREQTAAGSRGSSRTGSGTAAQEAKQQARNIDPGMESARAEAVAGERKAVTSFWSQLGEKLKATACLRALIRPAEKTPVEELTGEAPGALNCIRSVPCMPAESGAGNRVTWNHFFTIQLRS